MSKWSLAGSILFGAIFAAFAFGRIEQSDSRATRLVLSTFIFGFYCAVVALSTEGKKRTLTLFSQTLLGVACAFAIAALLGSSQNGYVVAGVLGLFLGFSADVWAKYVQLP